MKVTLAATPLVPGRALGPVLALGEPLSLWGGVDPASGLIVEARHPDHGRSIAGSILALPAVRGSSSSSSVLAELLRAGLGPLGIVLGEPDEILVVGAVVARELYGVDCPVMLLNAGDYAAATACAVLEIAPDGSITGT
jgi:predicted aconitase with swiveling domain